LPKNIFVKRSAELVTINILYFLSLKCRLKINEYYIYIPAAEKNSPVVQCHQPSAAELVM
jgi:hypothetical protein